MKTIIAGTDFTPSSLNACRYAAGLAKKLHCKLLVFNLYTNPVLHANSGLFFLSYDALRHQHEEKMHRLLNRLHREFPDVVFEEMVTSGSFKQELKHLVKHHFIEAIVLGLASRTRLSRYIYGSHSTDIAGMIHAPVIIVPEQFKLHSWSSALLCVDNEEKLHATSMERFELFLKQVKAKLRVLHVRTPDEVLEPEMKSLKLNGKTYRHHVTEAISLEDGVREAAREQQADLVVIISRKHSAFYHLFIETNTKKVAFASKVPVMSLYR